MPGPLADCYVLAPSRSAAGALEFLQRFVPDHTPQWDASDPSDVLGVPPDLPLPELLRVLEQRPGLAYSMYFRSNAAGEPYFAILGYCPDGALVFGLSGDEADASARALLRQLESHVGTQGYWSVEEAPADTREEFLARRKRCG